MAKKIAVVSELSALVLCKSIIGTSHPVHKEKVELVGLSLAPQDRQELELELGVDEKIYKGALKNLKVDHLYNATISKGASTAKNAVNFTVKNLNEIDNGKYDERMVVAGDITGHINVNILPTQEDIFFEGEEYNIVFEEVEA